MIKQTQLVQLDGALGLRIPQALVDKYGLRTEVVLEEREEGLLIHARQDVKLSWEETYRQIAAESEDWSGWHDIDDEDELEG